jgi:hypothetical protein
MDADLQDPPEAIPSLLDKLSDGYDVVFAGRCGKYEAGHRLLTSRFYKWVLHLLTGVPRDAGLFLAAKLGTLKKVLAMQVAHPHLVAMIGVSGARGISIPVERSLRHSGTSAYSSWMRLKMGSQAALWAFGWRLGFNRSLTKSLIPGFPVRERLGDKFR